MPLKSTFYNRLVNKEFDDKHYEHAKRLWMMRAIMTLCNWHHFYLRLDVLLLADVSRVFGRTIIGSHKLDCMHCPSLPSVMLQLMLKVTEVELELINDPNIYLMIECGLHSGLSNVVQCDAIANFHAMPYYHPDLLTLHLLYLDCNSLYTTCQTYPLPVGGFCFL